MQPTVRREEEPVFVEINERERGSSSSAKYTYSDWDDDEKQQLAGGGRRRQKKRPDGIVHNSISS